MGFIMNLEKPGCSREIFTVYLSHKNDAGILLFFSISPCWKNSSNRRYTQLLRVSKLRVGYDKSAAWIKKSKHCCWLWNLTLLSVLSMIKFPLLSSLSMFLCLTLLSMTLRFAIWSAMSVARIIPIIRLRSTFYSSSEKPSTKLFSGLSRIFIDSEACQFS